MTVVASSLRHELVRAHVAARAAGPRITLEVRCWCSGARAGVDGGRAGAEVEVVRPHEERVGADVAAEVRHGPRTALILNIRMVERHAHPHLEVPRVNPPVPPENAVEDGTAGYSHSA